MTTMPTIVTAKDLNAALRDTPDGDAIVCIHTDTAAAKYSNTDVEVKGGNLLILPDTLKMSVRTDYDGTPYIELSDTRYQPKITVLNNTGLLALVEFAATNYMACYRYYQSVRNNANETKVLESLKSFWVNFGRDVDTKVHDVVTTMCRLFILADKTKDYCDLTDCRNFNPLLTPEATKLRGELAKLAIINLYGNYTLADETKPVDFSTMPCNNPGWSTHGEIELWCKENGVLLPV